MVRQVMGDVSPPMSVGVVQEKTGIARSLVFSWS
jgi:hypothetical protein